MSRRLRSIAVVTIAALATVLFLPTDAVSQGQPASAPRGQPPDTLLYVIEGLPDHVALRTPLEFAVRVENWSRATISLPDHIAPGGGYVEIVLLDPDGDQVRFLDELIPEFQGLAQDIVRLKPGSFYGQRTSLGPLSKEGQYQLTLILHGPAAPQVPDMVKGDLTSAALTFRVD